MSQVENGNFRERALTHPIFSGTTISIFRTCAISFEGRVLFYKSREPKHTYPNLYYTTDIYEAQMYAEGRALKLGDMPLVMEGMDWKLKLFFLSGKSGELPPHRPFVVNRLWVPENPNVEGGFEEVKPTDLLDFQNMRSDLNQTEPGSQKSI